MRYGGEATTAILAALAVALVAMTFVPIASARGVPNPNDPVTLPELWVMTPAGTVQAVPGGTVAPAPTSLMPSPVSGAAATGASAAANAGPGQGVGPSVAGLNGTDLFFNPAQSTTNNAADAAPVRNAALSTPFVSLTYGDAPGTLLIGPAAPPPASASVPSSGAAATAPGPTVTTPTRASGGRGATSEGIGTSGSSPSTSSPTGPVTQGWTIQTFIPPIVKSTAGRTLSGLFLSFFGLALYQRIRERKLLVHAGRNAIFTAVGAKPGISLNQLSAETGIGYEVVAYHVDKLVAAGLLSRDTRGKPIRLFVAGTVGASELEAVSLLQRPTTKRVLHAVMASPGSGKGALCRALGLSGPTLSWHLDRLEATGLVRIEQEKIACKVWPNHDFIAALSARVVAGPATVEPTLSGEEVAESSSASVPVAFERAPMAGAFARSPSSTQS
ncbi:MAG: winged helix-turn-helix transcriptional regulator [Thermoplasmatota archaeon]